MTKRMLVLTVSLVLPSIAAAQLPIAKHDTLLVDRNVSSKREKVTGPGFSVRTQVWYSPAGDELRRKSESRVASLTVTKDTRHTYNAAGLRTRTVTHSTKREKPPGEKAAESRFRKESLYLYGNDSLLIAVINEDYFVAADSVVLTGSDTSAFRYDKHDRVAQWKNRSGDAQTLRIVNYAYDARGRKTEQVVRTYKSPAGDDRARPSIEHRTRELAEKWQYNDAAGTVTRIRLRIPGQADTLTGLIDVRGAPTEPLQAPRTYTLNKFGLPVRVANPAANGGAWLRKVRYKYFR